MLCSALCPCSYKRVVTPRRAGTAVVACWMVAFVVGLTPMLGWNNLQRLQENASIGADLVITCQFETVISMEYMVYFNFFGWVLPPLLLMLIIYAEIFYMIHRQLNKKVSASNADPSKYYDKELKLAKSLALVLFLFALSWLPLHILNCITLFCPACHKPMFLIYIAILLTHGNSAVNPVVYAFRIKRFRSAFLKIWKQYLCCKDTPLLGNQASERKDNHVGEQLSLQKDDHVAEQVSLKKDSHFGEQWSEEKENHVGEQWGEEKENHVGEQWGEEKENHMGEQRSELKVNHNGELKDNHDERRSEQKDNHAGSSRARRRRTTWGSSGVS
ncbi:hypothetical protein AAFF_G00060230 [Aldrovandia affinis]|uniref:Adenosine receptor A1 n=1 Tax=Aldrovandia affinis TaxID=143900 RepID=A0AAD7S061_9TELE|nr:hypothetical protein AAFF_G00060230 [Aldrovandia affinis]